jgi:hypothetical protein
MVTHLFFPVEYCHCPFVLSTNVMAIPPGTGPFGSVRALPSRVWTVVPVDLPDVEIAGRAGSPSTSCGAR